eukprot:TRINITY_DN14326_c0_g1_i2.p1 TRINITY_DN14326_c0_g1~~TRINITY_DN14326_c0_g1_i2.p1  ORF type:complete len:166 (+),score=14.15 TRINITY_DN14326_c0_g1_i2:368-865(+)
MGGELKLSSTGKSSANKSFGDSGFTPMSQYSGGSNSRDQRYSNKVFQYQNSPYMNSVKKGPVRAYEMNERPSSAQQGQLTNGLGTGSLRPGALLIPGEDELGASRRGRPATAPGFRSFSPGMKPSKGPPQLRKHSQEATVKKTEARQRSLKKAKHKFVAGVILPL